ncbi:TetR/AcrR family transcriptional regulator [Anaerophilus nitritogenes]|uniref:TetR/AcrR family transcriptional regulator n=1 Tax=Anaerophilus nitritogenes TaxID=2498136 RepID=UPI00101C7556|nr:TetR/AcrR family transcriptional regulator [Anaerophilus nitritogenes]
MPKIIKDIEENIFNGAMELFGSYGYRQVDMKMIAQNAGIAVGTLYNYYSNKQKLFMGVLERSWQITFEKLDDILQENMDIDEKLEKFICILYDEISKRKGLGGVLNKENAFEGEDLQLVLKIKEKFFEKMMKILTVLELKRNSVLPEEIKKRIGISTAVMISTMIKEYPKEKSTNVEFIKNWITATLRD